MKSLVSLISNRLYDLQIMCNGKEVEVFSAIKASKVEIKALKVMLSQCKNSKFNIVVHPSKASWYDTENHYTVEEIVRTLESTSYTFIETLTLEMNLVKTMRDQGFASYNGDEWIDGKSRVFIKINSVADINNVMSVIANEYPELKQEQFHIGTNCLWIFREELMYEKEVRSMAPFIDRDKAAKYMKDFSM